MLEIPKEALFLAGKVFLKYRKANGIKRSPLPDFYIGAQAAIFGMELITRDLSISEIDPPQTSLTLPFQASNCNNPMMTLRLS